eukprot:m.26788 g.26788  ORF g.26788 m.26788 type:complete len:237 (+) comp29521_c0_seq1:643-1353(+)
MEDETVRRILDILPFCDTASVPVELFYYDFGIPIGNQTEDAACRREVDECSRSSIRAVSILCQAALKRLASYRLVEWKDPNVSARETLAIHPMIAEMLRERQKSDDKKSHIRSLCKTLSNAFSASVDDKIELQMYGKLYPHAQQCLVHMGKLNMVDADLFCQYGDMESLFGDNRQAKGLFEKCLMSSKNYDTKIAAYRGLATAERRLGHLSKALGHVKDGQREVAEEMKKTRRPSY